MMLYEHDVDHFSSHLVVGSLLFIKLVHRLQRQSLQRRGYTGKDPTVWMVNQRFWSCLPVVCWRNTEIVEMHELAFLSMIFHDVKNWGIARIVTLLCDYKQLRRCFQVSRLKDFKYFITSYHFIYVISDYHNCLFVLFMFVASSGVSLDFLECLWHRLWFGAWDSNESELSD